MNPPKNSDGKTEGPAQRFTRRGTPGLTQAAKQDLSTDRDTAMTSPPTFPADKIAESLAVYGGASDVQYPVQVATQVLHYLDQLAASYAVLGRSLSELGEPQEVAVRMVATLPAPSPWDQLLGPCYSASKVAQVLGGISRQAVADRRARHTLLGLKTADGVWVYPIFQFDEHQQVIASLPAVLKILGNCGIDEWTLAGWLVSQHAELGGQSAIAWLRRGANPQPVIHLAAAAARRFAQ